MKHFDLIIIGSGLAGLAAARKAQALGKTSVILEKSSSIGGRVGSELIEGCLLDKGFQVILPSYPAIKALGLKINLKFFSKGAWVYYKDGRRVFNDPLSNPFQYISASSKINTFSDLISFAKIVLKKSTDSTLSIINNADFSDNFREGFLKPFLRGILLDYSLSTPWNFSAFYLKNFMYGGAALPIDGVQDLPNKMATELNILLEKEVVSIEDGLVTCSDGSNFHAKKVIQTAPALTSQNTRWFGTTCFYFLYSSVIHLEKKLVLFPRALEGQINHIANLSEVSESYSPRGTALLSISTLGNSSLSDEDVKKFLVEKFDLVGSKLNFIKKFVIPEALPSASRNSISGEDHKYDHSDLVYAGDTMSFGSQHAAITSGNKAAVDAISRLKH